MRDVVSTLIQCQFAVWESTWKYKWAPVINLFVLRRCLFVCECKTNTTDGTCSTPWRSWMCSLWCIWETVFSLFFHCFFFSFSLFSTSFLNDMNVICLLTKLNYFDYYKYQGGQVLHSVCGLTQVTEQAY